MGGRRWVTALTADRDEGVTSLEILIVFPFVFFFTLFVLFVCEYEYSSQVALAAAEEGTRVASQSTGTDPLQDGYNAANAYVTSVGGSYMTTVSAGPPIYAKPPGFTITVSGYSSPFIIAFPGINDHFRAHISQTASALPETFSHG